MSCLFSLGEMFRRFSDEAGGSGFHGWSADAGSIL